MRRRAGAVERARFENECGSNVTRGSNPLVSAKKYRILSDRFCYMAGNYLKTERWCFFSNSILSSKIFWSL